MLLTILKCSGQPSITKNCVLPGVHCVEVEKPGSRKGAMNSMPDQMLPASISSSGNERGKGVCPFLFLQLLLEQGRGWLCWHFGKHPSEGACSPCFQGQKGFPCAACPLNWRRQVTEGSCASALVPATLDFKEPWGNRPEGPSLLMRAAEIRGSLGRPGAQTKPFPTLSSAGWESKVVWSDKRCLSCALSEAPVASLGSEGGSQRSSLRALHTQARLLFTLCVPPVPGSAFPGSLQPPHLDSPYLSITSCLLQEPMACPVFPPLATPS